MGSLDSLLSPQSVLVVGTDGPVPEGNGVTIDAAEPGAVAAGDVDLSGRDIAVVTSTAEAPETVTTLIEGGVESILVPCAVDREEWFRLVELATEEGVNLLGPEASLGIPSLGVRAGFDDDIDTGSIAIITEDSPTATSLVAEGKRRGLEFSTIIATGRDSTVTPADVLRALDDDEETTVVLARPNRIGRDFFDAARSASPDLGLAVHAPKWACSEEVVETDSELAARPEVIRDAVLKQAGVLSVDSVDRLLDLAPALAEQPLPDGDNVAIVSNAGGPGVMATDAVGTSRLSMAEFTDDAIAELEAVIPDRAFARNPLDLLADSDINVFSGVLDAVLTDPSTDAAVVISAPNPLFTFEEMADIVIDARSEHEAPVVTALMGGSSTDAAAAQLRQYGIPNYFDPFQAVAVIAALADQRDVAEKRTQPIPTVEDLPTVDVGRVDGTALNVLEAAGLTTEGRGDGVGVTVAVTGVPGLGPVIMVGVTEYADVLDDVAVRLAPASEDEIRTMLDDLRASQLLKGARGTEAVDVDELVEAIQRLSSLALNREEIQSVVASLAATADGAFVEDATLDVGHQ